jgi:DNA-binding MarR family transcriptional regulator
VGFYTKDNFIPRNSVGFALTRARNALVGDMDTALEPLGVSSQQMGLLFELARGEVNTPFELSKILRIDTGLMTRMLDKLEKQDVLHRVRSLEDRRSVELHLTEHGRRLAEQLREVAPNVLNARLEGFTPEEFHEFLRLLRKYIGE